MKKLVKLWFEDFSGDFIAEEDYFYKLLNKQFRIQLTKEEPEYLIYSCYGYNHLKYECVKIFYTAENIRPDFNLCDYAIGFDYMAFGDRYVRFPNYARYGEVYESIAIREALGLQNIARKTKFCNFIYSNAEADPMRDRFFRVLSGYKQVDSLGCHLNNRPFEGGDRYSNNWRDAKVEVQSEYKFSIAFENSSSPGYTTEKIMHAFAARTIPIYWGNPLISKEFNSKSFINCHEYNNEEQLIKDIMEIDRSDDLFLGKINEPCFHAGNRPYELTDGVLLDFFENIFSQPLNDAFRRPKYGTTVMYKKERSMQADMISKKTLVSKFGKVLRTIVGKLQ